MEKFGEQFLHQKDPTLHTTPAVEKTVERMKAKKEKEGTEAKGEKISQKPADKIEAYLNRFKNILNFRNYPSCILPLSKGRRNAGFVIQSK